MSDQRSEEDKIREKRKEEARAGSPRSKPSTHVPGTDPAAAAAGDPMGQPPDSPPNPNLPPDYENEPAGKPTK